MRYLVYSEFHKFNGKTYPIGTKFKMKDGKIYSRDGFMCMADSNKSHECLVADYDREGYRRGHYVNSIKKYLLDETYGKDRIEFLWNDDIAKKYARNHNPEKEPWLWNDDFYRASIDDLSYLFGKMLEVAK